MDEEAHSTVSYNSYQNGPDSPVAASSPTGETGFDRHYRIGTGGIGTVMAWGWALLSMIAVETSLDRERTFLAEKFHEVSIVMSWVFLTLFIIFVVLHYRRGLFGRVTDTTIKFIVIGHSGFWGLLVIISSSVLASFKISRGLAASAGFGFFEAFALFGVVGLTVMDLRGKLHAPQISVSNS